MTRRKIFEFSILSAAAVFGICVFLFPEDAYAWGPLAHLQFSQGALADLGALSPALRVMLTQFASEFLYGSLAADIIVGKNLAKYEVHCHNWNIGFKVLDRARSDAQRAFSYGFLSHLSVDTIAHNYYVPYKSVQGFKVRASGHAYWELRYDQKLSPDLWKLARHVSQKQFREHDEHLEDVLSQSYVVPFTLSKKLFGSLLLAARLKKWQKMSEVLAGERDLMLHDEEVGECRRLAVGNILDMLRHGDQARCVQIDPTGERNLHLAGLMRSNLKKRSDLTPRQQNEVLQQVRPAFREGIYGRLRLPELPEPSPVQETAALSAGARGNVATA